MRIKNLRPAHITNDNRIVPADPLPHAETELAILELLILEFEGGGYTIEQVEGFEPFGYLIEIASQDEEHPMRAFLADMTADSV